ncbi:MAG: hypothetical protein ACE37F_04130 [Nannocystaceae bacterium]|nr:hypothetical protein [bacterium]
MAYLTYTSLNSQVGEQRYCVARDIEFTTLTSCVVVVAESASYFNQVIGAHLVLVGTDGAFDQAAADEVIDVFRNATGRTYVLGNIDFWDGQEGGIGAAFNHMVQNLPDARVVNTGGAEITASIEGGSIAYRANGVRGHA